MTPDALEILVNRELRKTGIEPMRLQRRDFAPDGAAYCFDLVGLVSAYQHRWKVLIECRNRDEPFNTADIDAIRQRARANGASSALAFVTPEIEPAALQRASVLRIALLKIVDAQRAMTEAGLIEGSQIPAWVPEFTVQLMWDDDGELRAQLLEANDPEPILRLLRPQT